MQLSNEPYAYRNLITSARQIHVIDDIRILLYIESKTKGQFDIYCWKSHIPAAYMPSVCVCVWGGTHIGLHPLPHPIQKCSILLNSIQSPSSPTHHWPQWEARPVRPFTSCRSWLTTPPLPQTMSPSPIPLWHRSPSCIIPVSFIRPVCCVQYRTKKLALNFL